MEWKVQLVKDMKLIIVKSQPTHIYIIQTRGEQIQIYNVTNPLISQHTKVATITAKTKNYI